jgi:hypothetical protein
LANQARSYGILIGFAVVVTNPAPMSVKQARKLLGKAYRAFTDEQIEEIVILLDIVATDFVLTTVPKV